MLINAFDSIADRIYVAVHTCPQWDPEDVAAWEAGNKYIARRNLIWSVAAEHVGFSIWSIWSVMVLFMPASVYGFSPGDKFLLGATATLVGGCCAFPTPLPPRNSAAATGPYSLPLVL